MRTTIGLLAVAGLAAAAQPAGARASGRHVHRATAVPPADAVELATLAPPTRLGTLEQSYGDAAVARSRFRRAGAADGRAGQGQPGAGGASPACDPRIAEAAGYACRAGTGRVGYGQAYAFTPAYVSAPTTVGEDPAVQPPVTPAATGVFYAFDRLVSGARD